MRPVCFCCATASEGMVSRAAARRHFIGGVPRSDSYADIRYAHRGNAHQHAILSLMPIGDSSLSVSLDPTRGALEAALGAQYQIVRPLGRGGMGAVYLARERLLERLVAIKVLHRVDAESHERFLREARAAARLTHPNIVPLYSFGQTGETVFYVMGYVEGESLESLLRRAGRLPAAETARILGELADALDFAHRNGVVHRDVKP